MSRHCVLLLLAVVMSVGCAEVDDDGGTCPGPDPLAVTGIRDVEVLRRGASTLNALYETYRPSGAGEPVAAADLLLGVTSGFVAGTPAPRSRDEMSGTTSSRAGAVDDEPLDVAPSVPALQFRRSCVPPRFGSVDPIASIRVTSDADWTATTPAGAPIVDETLVLPSTTVRDESGTPVSIEDAFSGTVGILEQDLIPLVDYVDRVGVAPLTLAIRLGPTDATREHRFTITYSMASGDTFVATSDPVTVNRDRPLPARLTDTGWRLLRYSDGGAVIEPTTPDDGARETGLSFLALGPNQIMIAEIPEREICEYNVDVVASRIVFLDAERRVPSGPAWRRCLELEEPRTPLQRFFERFLGGTLAYRLEGRSLTLESVAGDMMYLESTP